MLKAIFLFNYREMKTMKKNIVWSAVIFLLVLVSPHDLLSQRGQQQQRAMSPEQAFQEFEQKLINLRDYRMTFSVATERAVDSKLEGELRVRGGSVIELSAEGTYNGRRVNARLNFDGTKLTGGTPAETFEETAPEDFYIHFVRGITRLGLTHTVMLLLEGEPPVYPKTEEEEQEFAVITYISTGERRFVGNVEAFPFGMSYSVFGESLGDGRLWINVTSGLPFRREGTLRLEKGTVNVVEFYGFSR